MVARANVNRMNAAVAARTKAASKAVC